MGCVGSKLDDLPAVALCRQRCTFLDEAIHHRYALAEAHLAYVHSLEGIGHSLHNFFDQDFANSAVPLSPKLNLPGQRKSDQLPTHVADSVQHLDSHSNSGSHIHFHSDSDDDSDSNLLHHSDHSSPLHNYAGHIEYVNSEQEASFPGEFMQMNYIKNKATPSVLYEQKAISPTTIHMGEQSSSYYPYPYSTNNYNSYSYYENPNNGSGDGGGMGGYYGLPPPEAASSSKPPPQPPSPPRSSAWEFLNPFESYDKYNSSYTPSPDSKEVREEEGIPDLEDGDLEHEVVKVVNGNPKFVDGGGGNYSKSIVDDEDDGKVVDHGEEASLYRRRPSVSTSTESDGMEYEVHVVEKKIVDSEEKSKECGNAGGLLNVFEVGREIEFQFERASKSGNEISMILEVGKLPYNRKHGAYQVSSKMLHVVPPSLSVVSSQPSTSLNVESSSSADKAGPAIQDVDEDVGMRSKNLSSTLQKLYLWEKKLYNEVKAEEKMRVIHDKKCRRLRRLNERGAETQKVDSTRTLIRSLSTKLRIAIQVVDKISVTINKIRDEELWPQLNELIQGLTRMWKCMLECHRSQCRTIKEARSLDAIGSGKKLSDAHLEATLQLEHELINWTIRFSSWIFAQKDYVRALNNWLLKCLLYEPEETPDGIAPFSPGRIGAPPVFIICNQWSQALDRISEKEVVDSMRVFATSVLQLWEKDKLEMHQRMMVNKDIERKVRFLDTKDEKLQKEIQALEKKIAMVSGSGDRSSLLVAGNLVYQSDTRNNSLRENLQRIFEAMENFTANSIKAYEELLQRSEEDRLAHEHERAS